MAAASVSAVAVVRCHPQCVELEGVCVCVCVCVRVSVSKEFGVF